jgi:hypothetical protein
VYKPVQLGFIVNVTAFLLATLSFGNFYQAFPVRTAVENGGMGDGVSNQVSLEGTGVCIFAANARWH